MTVSVNTGISVVLGLIDAANQISTLVRAAQASGRETLSQEEWGAIRRMDDAARADLLAALGGVLTPSQAGTGGDSGRTGPEASGESGAAPGASQDPVAALPPP